MDSQHNPLTTRKDTKMTTQPILRASESEVISCPEPSFTNSWHPVSHYRVINALTTVLEDAKVPVISKDYTLCGFDGHRMFGTWVIENGNSDRNHMIGFRNSTNKNFAVGFCSGLHITVCSNMMFTGEFTTFHRHTSGLTDDKLLELAEATYGIVKTKTAEFAKWHDSLRPFYLNKVQMKALAYDVMDSGIVAPRRFKEFSDALVTEVKAEDDNPSLYTLHGGVTRLVKNDNLFGISNTNRQLISFCDDYMKLAA